ILGVLRNSRPRGDLILFRGHGDVLEHAGIIRGMSGSPVYIDGKLVGAVSFAYPGTMDPIGAITPIGEMLPLLQMTSGDERSARGAGAGGDHELLDPTPGSRRSTGDPSASTAPGSWDRFESVWSAFLTPASRTSGASSTAGAFGGPSPALADTQRPVWMPAAPPQLDTNGFAPLATPVSMSGWSNELAGPMAAAMQGLGFAAAAVPGGQAGLDVSTDAHDLEPGSAVGVRLIGGDADLVAIGTV